MSKPLSRANSSATGAGSAPAGDAVNVQVILRCRCGASWLAWEQLVHGARRLHAASGWHHPAWPCLPVDITHRLASAGALSYTLVARRPPSNAELADRKMQVVKCDEAMRAVTLTQSVPGGGKQSVTRTYHFDKVSNAGSCFRVMQHTCRCWNACLQP